jgi:DNA-directed RNA polymerase subunit RPC12/RpoP
MVSEKSSMCHSLEGCMITDYFEFWCAECGSPIDILAFHSEDSVGVKLKAICKKCNKPIIFKIKVTPQLSP